MHAGTLQSRFFPRISAPVLPDELQASFSQFCSQKAGYFNPFRIGHALSGKIEWKFALNPSKVILTLVYSRQAPATLQVNVKSQLDIHCGTRH